MLSHLSFHMSIHAGNRWRKRRAFPGPPHPPAARFRKNTANCQLPWPPWTSSRATGPGRAKRHPSPLQCLPTAQVTPPRPTSTGREMGLRYKRIPRQATGRTGSLKTAATEGPNQGAKSNAQPATTEIDHKVVLRVNTNIFQSFLSSFCLFLKLSFWFLMFMDFLLLFLISVASST